MLFQLRELLIEPHHIIAWLIICKDGTEERILSRDMPDLATLVAVMAARGITVRDIY